MHRGQKKCLARNFVGSGDVVSRELHTEEKLWCLEQAMAIVKEAGPSGASNMRDTASALQSLYQALSLLRQSIKEA
jgi:hypothetical protein